MARAGPWIGIVVAAFGLMRPLGAASGPITLQWEDLMPREEREALERALQGGGIPYGEMTPAVGIDPSTLVTTYNGTQVRIPGYVLPLEYDGGEVREFLLVPYIGACIHVPPPPPNQIVYVTSEVDVPVDDMFEAVWVTGTINTASISNDLADIGYQIAAELVEPYE